MNEKEMDTRSSYPAVLNESEMTAAQNVQSKFAIVTDENGNTHIDFSATAQAAGLSGVEIQTGTRLDTDSIVGKPLTIVQCGVVRKPPKEMRADNMADDDDPYYAVVRFKEYPDCYYNGSGMLREAVKAFMAALGDPWMPGMAITLNEELKKANGWKCRLDWHDKSTAPGQRFVMLNPA